MLELPSGYETHPNFSRGLGAVDLSDFGKAERGKVRDSVVLSTDRLAIVTTDRQSAFDRVVGTIPGKGAVLNGLSAYWFAETEDIIPNHVIDIPHHNVLIANRAHSTLPVEVIVRRYMAKSSTPTSIYDNYIDKPDRPGRRNIYGIDFPDGLIANQELPMGNVVTPTTKAGHEEHDQELTDEEAMEIVGEVEWAAVRNAALDIFERGRRIYRDAGLLLVDTKYEFGYDSAGRIMLIDEVHTPDSSRIWLASTYSKRLENGENPDTFDKEILRRWLAENGFKGEGNIPVIPNTIIDQMAEAYKKPYEMLIRHELPTIDPSPDDILRSIVDAM